MFSDDEKRWFNLLDTAISDHTKAAALIAADAALLEQRDIAGETVLHYLVIENELEAARFLLAQGADVNTRDDFGDTPLISAAILDYPEMCQLLLDWGADPALQDEHQETALHKCGQRFRDHTGVIVRMLLAAGAKPLEQTDLFDEARPCAERSPIRA
jgi:ankyrin repeat protein